jgi:hypothetical protein
MTETPQWNRVIENILTNGYQLQMNSENQLVIANLVSKLQCSVIQNLAGIQRATAFEVVVEYRSSPNRARERYRELSCITKSFI